MSNFRGHVAGSGFVAVVYLTILSLVFAINLIPDDRAIFNGFAFPIVLVALTVMFGIFPDIDTNSKAQDFFYSAFFIADLALVATDQFQLAAYLGLVAMLPVLTHHRGWTHTKWAALLVPSPLVGFPWLIYPGDPWVGLPYYGAAILGYFSHLYLDKLIFKRRFGIIE
jgi:membrane-bound metal-dependent hydrolase YbcI (DUF457 family)